MYDRHEHSPVIASAERSALISKIRNAFPTAKGLEAMNLEELKGYARVACPKTWEELSNHAKAELKATDPKAFRACVADYEARTGMRLR